MERKRNNFAEMCLVVWAVGGQSGISNVQVKQHSEPVVRVVVEEELEGELEEELE